MILQDKGTNSAHTSLKESLSKITGSVAREKTVGSSKKKIRRIWSISSG